MKVSELTGATLDYWVAKAEGVPDEMISWSGGSCDQGTWLRCCVGNYGFCPSRNWAQGGPIIERERIDINTSVEGWEAYCDIRQTVCGDTPLEAAMRAFVSSKYGEEVLDEVSV